MPYRPYRNDNPPLGLVSRMPWNYPTGTAPFQVSHLDCSALATHTPSIPLSCYTSPRHTHPPVSSAKTAYSTGDIPLWIYHGPKRHRYPICYSTIIGHDMSAATPILASTQFGNYVPYPTTNVPTVVPCFEVKPTAAASTTDSSWADSTAAASTM
ncbi:hypothetical protein K432DRAFT_384536 [Lepidopterella palustris CBS 459.81]|uniref:Uncharacterized protein n=1 Tax=Lepidopterella palustris CBS 459.81 TaxID=1314670 RepID=A0A8E2E591_9PEZI|nr:hypothetical protein K432DRAFT_384536 [Lepidopterella palustris CBS 459.81]